MAWARRRIDAMLWVQPGVNRWVVYVVWGLAEGTDAGWAFVGWQEGEDLLSGPKDFS